MNKFINWFRVLNSRKSKFTIPAYNNITEMIITSLLHYGKSVSNAGRENIVDLVKLYLRTIPGEDIGQYRCDILDFAETVCNSYPYAPGSKFGAYT